MSFIENKNETAKELAAVASDADEQTDKKEELSHGIFTMYKRIFAYCNAIDITLNIVGMIAAAGSGVALALIQLVFGNFVTIISDFQNGLVTRAEFDAQISDFALNFVYIFIARFALTYVFIATYTVSGYRISRTIRQAFLKASLRQEIAYFDSGEGGSVTTKVTTNGNQVQSGISDKVGSTVQALAACIAAIVLGLIVQWKLMLITLTIAPVMLIVIGIVMGFIIKMEARQQAIWGDAGVLAEDVIGSVRNVAAFWMRPRLVKRYDTYLQQAHDEGKKESPYWGFLFSIEYFCIYSGFALAFWQGVRMYQSGEITDPGDIVAVLFSVVIAATSLTGISPFAQTFAAAASAADALFKTIDRESQIDPLAEGGKIIDKVEGDIQLHNINFEYPTRLDVPVLQNFSVHCEPGKTTAFVGASGSGKSTIVALLERWYNPSSGNITIDGQAIDSFNLKWLRTKVRLVQQEPVLLNGSVLDNVINGLTGTPLEHAPRAQQEAKSIEACKMAFAHEFVSELPEGYNTNVGERAGLLSGGQKQRIAIARALVSDPKILLLDEATSALDPHSEGLAQKALDSAAKGRTTLVIAHKLATIKHADKIVVMQKGRILETGTHDSLLAQNGVYTRLVGVQDLGKASAGDSSDDEAENEGEKPMELTRTQTNAGERKLSDYQEGLDYEKHKSASLFKVVPYVLKEQPNLTWISIPWVFAILIGGATFPGQALILSNLINVFSLTGAEMTREANFYALMFFVIAIGNLVAYWGLGYISNIICQSIGHFYRKAYFDVTLQQDIQFFDRAENTTGAVASRLSTMPTHITELFGFNLSLIFMITVNLIASSILGMAYGWKLGLVLIFGGLPALVGSGYLKMRLDFAMAKRTTEAFTSSAGVAGEAVAAIRTISSLAMEGKTLERFSEKVDGIIKESTPFIMHSSFWYALSQSAEFGVLALGFWYGCQLVASEEYTVKQFFIVFTAVFFSGQAAGQFFQYTTSITKGVGAVNYLMWLRSIKPLVSETPSNANFGPDKDLQILEANNAEFIYPTRPKDRVLRGVDVSAKKGTYIALVGGSGSGKSTMVSLLERFYDPSSGSIDRDGQSVATFSPRLYRSDVSLVQQEPTLYRGTIRDNIALGSATSSDELDTSEDKIRAACRDANISDFISSLPEGLDTEVGSRGLSLSGGQRQRIAIARALVRDPRVLLLDEATSALDTESERVVQAALNKAAASSGERITVAIAHRLSTIKNADRIHVLVRGRIVEVGSHHELLRRGQIYADMCKAQSLNREA